MLATTAPLNTRQEIGHHHPDQALNAETPHAYTSHHLSPADRDANDVASCIEYNDVVENSFDSSGSLEIPVLSQFAKSSPTGPFYRFRSATRANRRPECEFSDDDSLSDPTYAPASDSDSGSSDSEPSADETGKTENSWEKNTLLKRKWGDVEPDSDSNLLASSRAKSELQTSIA